MDKELHSDQELIQKLASDDSRAFEIIYNKYWEKLYAVAFNRMRSKETAEELIQDLFTELWDRRHKLNIYKSLSSFLFSAMKYKILNYIRAQAIRTKYKEEAMHTTVTYSDITQEQLSFDELYATIEKEIEKLPEKCRLVFRMNREGATPKEISQELNISHRTVETHINNARKTLKANLSTYSAITLIFICQ